MKKTLIGLSTVLLLAVCVLSIAVHIPQAHAGGGGGTGIRGWAWSSNIGWISASSTDSGAGGGPYGLTADASGNITGYMWSSNIGWIKFGGLSSFPASGSNAGNAKLNTTNGSVTGWARACAGTIPGDCSSMNSRTDGWDGWIELSGVNHPTGDLNGNSGVTIKSDGTLVGYAWGGKVVGWIQFDSARVTGGNTSVGLCQSCSTSQPAPTGTVTGYCTPSQPTDITTPGIVTFTASAFGGSGTFDYSWDGGLTWVSNSNADSINYGGSGSGPILYVRDDTGPGAPVVASPNCGNVVYTGGGNNGGNGSSPVTLFLGLNQSSLNKTFLPITRGQSFMLGWTNTLDSSYTCSPTVSPSLNPNGSGWTSLSSFSGQGNTSLIATNNIPGVSQTAVGTYKFTLSCSNGSKTYAPYVNLRVTSTNENPI